ncbi:chemotaxis protein CheD [Magnetococcus sp. PR-3]|uniref:chemotaxis protein CheD n=1 Tax=Magnetococcus sp. PR-3 TaxID=3120355 RepID=UPI002FCE6228
MQKRPSSDMNLGPGELFIGFRHAKVRTILGSCVSVTLYHKGPRPMGAICHARLPNCGHDLDAATLLRDDDTHYMDSTLTFMIRLFREMGFKDENVEAKLFGGSNMFDKKAGPSLITVGLRNIQTAMDILNLEGLHLVSSDVGGSQSRTLLFDTKTGEVFMKRGGMLPNEQS